MNFGLTSIVLLVFTISTFPAFADIHLRLPGQTPGGSKLKRLFILNEKSKKITYVEMKETDEGVFEGKVKVTGLASKIAEHYRVGQPLSKDKRYHSFSYREEGNDLFIDLEPILETRAEIKRLWEGEPKGYLQLPKQKESPSPSNTPTSFMKPATDESVVGAKDEATAGAYSKEASAAEKTYTD